VKWEDYKDIDLLIGGSPCQSFSIAGKQEWFNGKSWLFYEYLRILKEVKPKYFLLENVKMKKEWQDVISKELWCEPININSSLVCPALRNRFYWTNIPDIQEPKDKWIELQSIISSGFTDRKKARALLESDSRPLKDKKRMWHRYFNTGFTTIIYENWIEDKENIRYMNQNELEKCQTLPVWYTSILDRNKAASVIGNWWTVDVISHIFSFIK
jgi:DNA (cytosine-5)-methyltransferase 3A